MIKTTTINKETIDLETGKTGRFYVFFLSKDYLLYIYILSRASEVASPTSHLGSRQR